MHFTVAEQVEAAARRLPDPIAVETMAATTELPAAD